MRQVTKKKIRKWKYDEKDIADQIKTQLPDNQKLRWFSVQSGDSGDTYNVQLLYFKGAPKPAANCNCWNGQIMFPLAAQGLDYCKHVKYLLECLSQK